MGELLPDREGETLNYFCSFETGKPNSKELTKDKIVIKELDDFGHYTEIKGVQKLNILS